MATDFGQMIRHARHAQGLTLEDLAERVGVTPGALSHIESGRRLPNPKNAIRIAQVLGLAEEDVMLALDEEHSLRRRDSLGDTSWRESAWLEAGSSPAAPAPSAPLGSPSDSPSFSERPIEDLFARSDADVQAVASRRRSAPSEPAPRELRNQARWSSDASARIHALLRLADSASDAIRTLRGALEDEDPRIRHEARRLLRELDVRLPEE